MSFHACPVPGCTVEHVPDHLLMCAAHWKRVPKFLQDLVYRTWNAFQRSKGEPLRERVQRHNDWLQQRAKAIGFAQRSEN